jgi:ferredoxin
MAKLLLNEVDELDLEDGSPIKEVCEEAGVPFACEEGVCGTCVIEVEEGMENLTEFTEEEVDFLGEQECERLACQCRIRSGCVKVKF